MVARTILPPMSDFSWAGVPWAAMRPWSRTMTWSASRSASSRYWVVSTTVVPAAVSSATTAHSAWRAAGSRPGGGLVEEQHGR